MGERGAGGLPLERRPGRGDVGPWKRQPDVGTAAPPRSHPAAELKEHRTQAATRPLGRQTDLGPPPGGVPRSSSETRQCPAWRPAAADAAHQPPRCPLACPHFPRRRATPWPRRPRQGGSTESETPTSHRGAPPAQGQALSTCQGPSMPSTHPQVTSLLGPRASVAPTAPSASLPEAGSLRAVLAPAPMSWVPRASCPHAHPSTPLSVHWQCPLTAGGRAGHTETAMGSATQPARRQKQSARAPCPLS